MIRLACCLLQAEIKQLRAENDQLRRTDKETEKTLRVRRLTACMLAVAAGGAVAVVVRRRCRRRRASRCRRCI